MADPASQGQSGENAREQQGLSSLPLEIARALDQVADKQVAVLNELKAACAEHRALLEQSEQLYCFILSKESERRMFLNLWAAIEEYRRAHGLDDQDEP